MKVENLNIKRVSGYGQYQVIATVNGVDLRVHTTNSEAFDWFDDISNKQKNKDAISYCKKLAIRHYKML